MATSDTLCPPTSPTAVSRRSILIGAGAAYCIVPTVALAQANVHLAVGTAPLDSGIPPLVGVRGGFFRRVGLDVDVQALNSGAAMAAAVAGGALQIAASSLMASSPRTPKEFRSKSSRRKRSISPTRRRPSCWSARMRRSGPEPT